MDDRCQRRRTRRVSQRGVHRQRRHVSSDAIVGQSAGEAQNVAAPLSVSGGIGSNAVFILNQTNSGDLLTASTSGVTKFVITNSGGVGINTGTNNSTLLSTLDVRPNLTNGGTISIASASGKTSFAGLLVDNTGVGDLFTASKSGATKFVVLNNGNLQFAGQTPFLTTLASAATAAWTVTIPATSANDNFCLQSLNNCSGS